MVLRMTIQPAGSHHRPSQVNQSPNCMVTPVLVSPARLMSSKPRSNGDSTCNSNVDYSSCLDLVRGSVSSVRIRVLVRPNAARTELAGFHGGDGDASHCGGSSFGPALEVRLHAPPRDGEANKEIIRFIRSTFQLAASQVELAHGEKSRQKVILIKQVDIEAIRKRIEHLFEQKK